MSAAYNGDVDGGSAFPVPYAQQTNGDQVFTDYGMSLRDWFAGQVLAGWGEAHHRYVEAGSYPRGMAAFAYEVADDMLAIRRSTP